MIARMYKEKALLHLMERLIRTTKRRENRIMLTLAADLYYEYCDMDYMDYAEHREDDILFICELLKECGLKETRQILDNMF